MTVFEPKYLYSGLYKNRRDTSEPNVEGLKSHLKFGL